jgi:hypothetical protein
MDGREVYQRAYGEEKEIKPCLCFALAKIKDVVVLNKQL